MKPPEPDFRLPKRRGSVDYALGSEADQEAVYQALLHVFHGPDRESFLGALSDPAYRPEQRILAKVDGRVASHVHLTERAVRYGSVPLPMNGIMWVGTLPEFRRLGLAQNLMRFASARAKESGIPLQTLTTGIPRFYQKLGWGVCGNQCFATTLSRNLPQVTDGVMEVKGGFWHVRPWRQVELNDLMTLYDRQFAGARGSVLRSEDYWRWIIGRKYAHVIWVACQGETVRGYAFVKDHRVLEIASDPAYPQALKALLGRVRAEALERAYPEVIVHAPIDHPVIEAFRQAAGRIVDQEVWEGTSTLYHIPSLDRCLTLILPELARLVRASGVSLPFDLGLVVKDQRRLIHIDAKTAKVEPDKLGRRYLTLTPSSLARLVMGHTGIDAAMETDHVDISAGTAIEAARIIFPKQPIWRSPLDSATA